MLCRAKVWKDKATGETMISLARVNHRLCDVCGHYDRDCLCSEHRVNAYFKPEEVEYYDADVEVLQH